MPTFGRTSDSVVVNPTVDRYTATAAQTVFTLTNTPSSQVLVWVNGILQEPTTHYTLSGRTLTLGTACTVGDKVAVEYGSGGGAGAIKMSRVDYVGGNKTTSSTTFTNAALGDLGPITGVSAGDVLRVGASMDISTSGTLVYGDFQTLVAGSPVNYVSSGTGTPKTDGLPGFRMQPGGAALPVGSPFLYVIQASDLSSGVLTLRFVWRVDSGTGTINADGTFRFAQLWAEVYTGTVF